MLRRLLLPTVLGLLVPVLPVSAAEPLPGPITAPVCDEAGGQTDTPPHPRLRRDVVAGVDVPVKPPMRRQADAFNAALTAADVQHVNERRDCGLHWWTRWRPDLSAFWQAAAVRWRR